MRIITADPTLRNSAKKKVQNKKHIHLIEVAIGHENNSVIGNKIYKSMTFGKLRMKYSPISVVKIDVEGSEHVIFNVNFPTHCNVLKGVDQVLIEIHGTRGIQAIFNWFSECNMLLYSKEPNIWGCGGTKCGEYSFISAEFAYKEYITSR